MFAVIPHPTEALILSRTQKATLSRLNAEAEKSLWIPLFPLWAFFNNFDCRAPERGAAKKKQMQHTPFTNELQITPYDDARQNIRETDGTFDAQQLKTIRDAIASFTIGTPEVLNGEFFFPAVLRFRNGVVACGKIIAGKICDDKEEAPLHTGKKTDDDANSPRTCENEKKLFARFPRSCSVFRIADAEIGERKTANGENAADKIAGKCAEDTSSNTDDTDGIQLRTWRVHTSLWVKTKRIQ